MSIVVLASRGLRGIDALEVMIEVSITRGLPRMLIVGLAETSVRESEHRVRSAIISSGFDFPLGRIVINLAPADMPKHTSRYDLPIALAILIATRQIQSVVPHLSFECVGELSLSGLLREVIGLLPIAQACAKKQRIFICPKDGASEASRIKSLTVKQATSLQEVAKYLNGDLELNSPSILPTHIVAQSETNYFLVKGQKVAKRALLVAASGGHNMLMVGSPGTGKTMLAQSIVGLLPPLSEAEAMESASIYSVAQGHGTTINWGARPFRAPHHSSSVSALLGGGVIPKPGEISLSHHGVLFLDELTEMKRTTLESLRQPMESGKVCISRTKYTSEFPARCMVVAAMNPCHCGYYGDEKRSCGGCNKESIISFRRKISGPIIDRFDIQIELPREKIDLFDEQTQRESDVRQAIQKAREIQINRQGKLNAYLSNKELVAMSALAPTQQKCYSHIIDSLHLSARASVRLLRVALTVNDFGQKKSIEEASLFEAASYRSLDRHVS
ncbi:MAG: YifB family Mg chelatase-like AAA ATPase [Methylacidiphilales bacterium]|nr:YifB family Mg chelatase-like AAA ATPase [Candidatus Methylacidiphilales bacterium]